MFGDIKSFPQDELSKFLPRNPYGFSKLYAHWATMNYRKHYGLYSVSGILYNHESPRRKECFVTKKIINSAIRIKLEQLDKLFLGNLDSKRDWGYAPEYVEVIWKIMQQSEPDDYVIGTGDIHSVKEFCEFTFNLLDLDYKKYIVIDKNLCRERDKSILLANTSKASSKLGWKPKN